MDHARDSAWAGRTQSKETPWPRDPRPSTGALGPCSRFPLCLIQLLCLLRLAIFLLQAMGQCSNLLWGIQRLSPRLTQCRRLHGASDSPMSQSLRCLRRRRDSSGTRARAPPWLVPRVLQPCPGSQPSHLPADPRPARQGGSQHPAWALRCSRPPDISPDCLLCTRGSSFCSSSHPAERPGVRELGFAGAGTWVRPDPTAYWLRDLERVT